MCKRGCPNVGRVVKRMGQAKKWLQSKSIERSSNAVPHIEHLNFNMFAARVTAFFKHLEILRRPPRTTTKYNQNGHITLELDKINIYTLCDLGTHREHQHAYLLTPLSIPQDTKPPPYGPDVDTSSFVKKPSVSSAILQDLQTLGVRNSYRPRTLTHTY
jgi:hypothetical protein